MGPAPGTSSQKAIYALIAAWVLLGLFGHDPWKPDEAYSFGLVYSMLQSGDWVVPTLAGEPFMEKPPLFYATAALLAKLFAWLMPLHDGARLASALYVAISLYFTARLARSLSAALLLVACIGYVHHAHLLITDNALVAGIAMGLYGLAARNGWLLGTGAGIAFLSKGLLGPGILALTTIALLAFPAHRSLSPWWKAIVAFLPWGLLWPWLLHRQSPALFEEWLWVQNLGRFSGEATIGGVADHLHYLKALPWFAFPAWPLAAWAAWKHRNEPLVQVSLTAFLAMFVVLSASSAARQIYALPMLVPLAALAAIGLPTVQRWLGSPLDKAALWGGGAAGLALWGMWLAHLLGHLPQADYPGFTPSINGPLLVIAVAVTGAWVFYVKSTDIALRWAAAVTLVWGLAMTLWLPWLDYSKTYAGMIADMKRTMPASAGCVANRELGEPQRALFHYFAGIVSVREGSPAARDCRLLLVQAGRDASEPPHGPEWKVLWKGMRPGEDSEHYWLFSR